MTAFARRRAVSVRIRRLAAREADMICAVAGAQNLVAAFLDDPPTLEYDRRIAIDAITRAAREEGRARERWRAAYRALYRHEPASAHYQ